MHAVELMAGQLLAVFCIQHVEKHPVLAIGHLRSREGSAVAAHRWNSLLQISAQALKFECLWKG